MHGVERFEDLLTWQLLPELEGEIARVTQHEAVKRELRFRSQITDAAGSAVRNVAEGFGRYNPTEFARFLDVSRASALEVQACLQTALTAGWIARSEFDRLYSLTNRGLQAVARFQRYLRSPQAKANARRFRYSKSRGTRADG